MIKVLLLVVLLLLTVSPCAVWWFVLRSIPGLDGFGDVPRLGGTVLVRFDGRAVPYVEADSEQDMYAAQGYLVARDRMFQMDMMRRLAEGRCAEIFGIGSLPADRLTRTIGFERLAQDELNYLSDQAKSALEAYTRGVNAYLDEYGDRLPFEFTVLGYRPGAWRPVDSLAILKYHNYELDESWKLDEFRWRVTNKVGDRWASQLFKDDWACSLWSPEPNPIKSEPTKSGTSLKSAASISRLSCALSEIASATTNMRRPAPSWGSTAWALPPSASTTGGAILAADKHAGLTSPNDWYLCSLSSPTSHVAGACVPGVPGVMFGRNKNIAWGASLLKADVQDLFVEHFDSEFGNKYQIDKEEKKADIVSESIPVRFGKDVETKITTTRHGPVLLRDKESAVALSWTGFETKRPVLNAIIQINHAGTWDDFVQAIDGYSGAPQLFVFADHQGGIGCHAAGLIPTRAANVQSITMSEGWLKNSVWTGLIPFADLPQAFTPAGAAGNFCIAAGQKIGNAKKPSMLLGHQWSPPYRANRLALGLPRGKNGQKLNLSDCNAFQSDELNMLSRLVADNLKQASDRTKSIDSSQFKILRLFGSWDGRITANSPCASAYESFVNALARRLVEPKLGRSLTNEYFERWPLWITFVEHCLTQKPADFLPPDERTYDTFLITTFAQANTRLKLFFQTDDVWNWRKIHLAQFKHLIATQIPLLGFVFDSPQLGVPADGECLNACDVKPGSLSGAFQSTNGPVVRLLIDMSDDDKFYGDMALGQSGHLLSPFKHDQLQSWLDVNPLPIAFSAGQIDKQTKYRLYLSRHGFK